MNRKQKLAIIGISFLALLTGILSSHLIPKMGLTSEPGVKAFFATEWQSPDGKSFDTKEWQGKILVVNFWGSWCPPCVEEMPVLEKLQSEFSNQNTLFIGIAMDSPSNVQEFLKKTPVSYPIAMGGLTGSQIYKALGNEQSALPFTVLISPSGKVLTRKLGKISEVDLRRSIKDAS